MKQPGDNGDRSDFDNFLDVVINRIVVNDMLPGLHIDIWNEPDLADVLSNNLVLGSLPIPGPSLSLPPAEDNTWSNFLSYVAANDTTPDYYSWHHIEALDNEANDLQNSLPTFDTMRVAAGAPEKPININEYLNLGDELNPAATVWHSSQFERYNVPGLRANWRGGPNGTHLRDFLASLLWRDNTDLPYHPNGDWQALNAAGLPSSGNLALQTWAFTYVIPETELDAPTNRGIATHPYANDEITIAIYQTEEDWKTAWAFGFSKA
ncbi:glycoside hydrolase family 39 protein [Ilyonectria robusta]